MSNIINQEIYDLLTEKITGSVIAPEKEGEKSSLVFTFLGWTEEIGKRGAKSVVPVVISKRSINSVLDVLQDITDEEQVSDRIAAVKPSKLVQLMDKKMPGWSGYLATLPLGSVEDRQTFSTYALTWMANFIQENSAQASMADPLLEAKRIFAKSAPFLSLDFDNPGKVFAAWRSAEMIRIDRIMEKAQSLTGEDLRVWIEEKAAQNGQDEDGFVLLRGKKKEEATEA